MSTTSGAWGVLLGGEKRLRAVGSGRDDADPLFHPQGVAETLPEKALILDDQDMDRHGGHDAGD